MDTKQALKLLTTVQQNEVRYILSHVDTCTSDYFCGYGSDREVIQVLVDETSTYQDIKDGILTWQARDHIEDLDVEAYTEAVMELFKDIKFPATTIPKVLQGVGSMEDKEDWDLYMFFTLETLGEDDE